jgi:hypothetical protein
MDSVWLISYALQNASAPNLHGAPPRLFGDIEGLFHRLGSATHKCTLLKSLIHRGEDLGFVLMKRQKSSRLSTYLAQCLCARGR